MLNFLSCFCLSVTPPPPLFVTVLAYQRGILSACRLSCLSVCLCLFKSILCQKIHRRLNRTLFFFFGRSSSTAWWTFACLSACLSACLPVCPFTSLLPVAIPTRHGGLLSVCLSVCLSVSLALPAGREAGRQNSVIPCGSCEGGREIKRQTDNSPPPCHVGVAKGEGS